MMNGQHLRIKLISVALLCLSTIHCSWAQPCDCMTQFSFIKNYFEQNSPAFQNIKNEQHNYDHQVQNLIQGINYQTDEKECYQILEHYVTLLNDHHSSIDYLFERQKLDTPAQVDSFKQTPYYRHFKKYNGDLSALDTKLKSRPAHDFSGIYYLSSGPRIAITENPLASGFYLGVVLDSTRFLEPGHILLEFQQISGDTLFCTYHLGLMGYQPTSLFKTVISRSNGINEIDLSKQLKSEPSSSVNRPFDIIILNKQTVYLRLNSFDRVYCADMDSFLRAQAHVLGNHPNLIIDIRNNSGGDERCFFELLPYLYTSPLAVDQAQVWVTPDNITRYKEVGYNPTLIQRMEQAKPFSFISQQKRLLKYWKLKPAKRSPQRVVLLFNRGTASSAEGLILYARQSKKVITMGQNSGGYLAYGDVMSTSTPCGKYRLSCTTTRYKNSSRYEYLGIPPQVFLDQNSDWIQAALLQFKI